MSSALAPAAHRPVVAPPSGRARRAALVLAGLLGGCASAPRAAAPPTPAELLVYAARVRTLDPARPLAEAVAISGGRILAVGDRGELDRFRGARTRVLDLGAATVVPGLVDAHLHLLGVGQAAQRLELRGLSLGELLARVEEAADERPPGVPILGRGWDQNRWSAESCPEGASRCLGPEGFPDRALLDAVAPEHPVVLTRVDGHALWAGSAALALGEVDASTPEVSGGRIHRRPDGAPSGVLVDNAMALVESKLPAPGPQAIEAALLAGQAHLLELGLTAIHDMGTSPEVLSSLRRLDREGRLKLRVFAYHWGNDGDLEALVRGGPERGRRLEVVGVKLMVDGALGSRGAALLEPYADADHAGALLLEPEDYARRVAVARAAGLQPATHAIGDRGNRLVIDTYAATYGERLAAARPRVEHAQILHPDDLTRLARLGALASVQPTHATSDMPWAEDRVGPERILGGYAWRALQVAGATLAAGSDAPVELADPRRGLYAARTRQDPEGRPPGGWHPEQSLTGAAALRVFTAGAAYAVKAEDRLGRLAPGYLADLTALSVDPVTAPPSALLAAEVQLTMVGGEPLSASPVEGR